MNEHCSRRVWEDSNQKGAALLLLLDPILDSLSSEIRLEKC
jgi:hypothetical protein